MAKKILSILILITLLIVPAIYAVKTNISVKTLSYHRLQLSALVTGEPLTYIQRGNYTDTKYLGELNFTINSNDSKIDLVLNVGDENGTVLSKRFYEVPTDKVIFITLTEDKSELLSQDIGTNVATTPNITTPINETNNTSLNQTNSTIVATDSVVGSALNDSNNKAVSPSNFSITGYASKFLEKNSKIFLYILIIIGVLVGILIIIFIIRKIQKKSPSYPSKLSFHKPNESTYSHSNASLSEAERKLREAQAEIEGIKRRNEEIREAEKRLNEDRIRLERLRRAN